MYFFNDTSLRDSGYYFLAEYNRLFSTFSYDYNRYKPYNGFFCLIACPDKSVEESYTQSQAITVDYSTVGFGYTWAFKVKKSAINLRTGGAYNYFFHPEKVSLGNATHNKTASTDWLSSVFLQFGIGMSFN